MPNWTKEQELAINKNGCNIIVSAGAGSGKTAVLTERVIRKLKNNEDITKLLILTFTNAAAKEMKERIRSAIKEENLLSQLDKIDSSYITTFDSFALSVVKKYHYLLNLDQDIEIGNDLILKWKKREILDEIIEKLYEEKNYLFLKLIKDFTSRDDEMLKEIVLDIYSKLDLKYDKKMYLDTYFETYYQNDFINLKIKEFLNIVLKKINKIKENLKEIELIVDGDFYSLLFESLKNLIHSETYDEIKNSLDIKLPKLKKGMDEVKEYKERISKLVSEIKKLMIYESCTEIKESIENTKHYVQIIVFILQELDKKINEFKTCNNLYEFMDISKLAIRIVSENKTVQEELRNSFNEILVDEYQDTSDLQELFISKISNNNVYMVGDIKQSIYRFRNANPNLFKEKYEAYQKNDGGFKIDLVKNFRSREETLSNINYLFNYIMDLEIGGADYKNSHQMIFGKKIYNEFKAEGQNNNFEIYNYEVENKEFQKDEIEAFIVAKDVLEKVNNKYQVFDKNKNELRDINYDDFVILIDKSKSFDLYKKIFEYMGISLTILKDETISGSYDIYILKNILLLLVSLKEKTFDKTFKYAYLSIGRSYLFNLSDDYLYQTLKENKYKDDPIIKHIESLLDDLENLPTDLLIEKIIDEFSFYEKLITVGNINESIIRFDYLESLSKNLSNLGYTYKDFLGYLTKMIEQDDEIKYSLNKEIKNSVKIMTIHKSKGLEYPICYYTGLTNKFNAFDIKKRFLFDENLGIITPYQSDGIKNTIYHSLYKDRYMQEDISEKIRLFYVALTRAKEKMILITSLKESEEEIDDFVSFDTRFKYSSFASILNSVADKLKDYLKPIDVKTLNLTKDYTVFKASNIFEKIEKTTEKIDVKEINLKQDIENNEHFSKVSTSLLTTEEKEKLEFGSYLHYLFEILDLKTKDLSFCNLKYKKYLENFLASDLLKNVDQARIYKEYEFIYTKDSIKKHGIIDLMLEYSDSISIIDYKLKKIEDKAYRLQLKGYKDYITNKTGKKVNLYLYSILTSTYQEIID